MIKSIIRRSGFVFLAATASVWAQGDPDGPTTFHNPGVGGRSASGGGGGTGGLEIQFKVPNGYDPRLLSRADLDGLPQAFRSDLAVKGPHPGTAAMPYSLDTLIVQNHPIVHGVRLYLSNPNGSDFATPFNEFLLDQHDRLKFYLAEVDKATNAYRYVDESRPQVVLGSTYLESMDISNYMPPLPANDKNAWVFKANGGYWEGDLSNGSVGFRLDNGLKETLRIARIEIYRVRGQGHPLERERFDRSVEIPVSAEPVAFQLCDRKCREIPANFTNFDFRTVLK